MARGFDIIAYQYAADIYCPLCIRTVAAFQLAAPGEAAFMGRPEDGDNAEQFLDRWAAKAGVDRIDESTFDSGDFPKVVFASQGEETEHCAECGCEID